MFSIWPLIFLRTEVACLFIVFIFHLSNVLKRWPVGVRLVLLLLLELQLVVYYLLWKKLHPGKTVLFLIMLLRNAFVPTTNKIPFFWIFFLIYHCISCAQACVHVHFPFMYMNVTCIHVFDSLVKVQLICLLKCFKKLNISAVPLKVEESTYVACLFYLCCCGGCGAYCYGMV